MHVIDSVSGFRAACNEARRRGDVVGLVPTMGYLHEGHRSLIRAARAQCDLVAVTIFVNPLQFGPSEDLDRYPRDLDGDVAASAAEGADLVFAPPVEQLYPVYPPATTVHVAGLTDGLCGATRPGHFDGVTTIVTKLFSITGTCRAYFGRKDAQQLAVIRRLAADLDLDVEVIGCPIVREPDGLAKSSRNAYLSADDRQAAPNLFAALRAAATSVCNGERDPAVVSAQITAELARHHQIRVDYIEVRDGATITPIERLDGDVLVALAAFLGTTRLIDNVQLRVDGADVVVDLGIGWAGVGGAAVE